MNYFDIVLIGIALSMDAAALTISNCTCYKDCLTKRKEWAMPITFALFQGIMPLIGYFVGNSFAFEIKSYSGYITSIVFFALCFKIIIDIIKEKRGKTSDCEKRKSDYGVVLLLIQGLATSIDALLIGVTFSLKLEVNVFLAVSVIAVVTFIIVSLALLFGKYLGKVFGKYANVVGAVILFILALKTLIETLM